MKFSIVVPVYNVEKYIDKCLNSIFEQSYKDFEVIIVNDETPDNSQDIIDKYVKMDNRFQSYLKKNGGLSDARNFGVKYATGDYLIFIDSDDYIEKDLLLELSKCSSGNDLIRYDFNLLDEEEKLIKRTKAFENSGKITFNQLINIKFFEPACGYAYNLKFWKENDFNYAVGRIHEDWGLTPICAVLAKNIYYLDYYGYNYIKHPGSIMNGAIKAKKRAYDVLYHFDNIKENIKNKDIDLENRKLLMSYMSNGAISTARILADKDLEDYIKELKLRDMYKYLLSDTFGRKIKKMFAKLNLKLYIKWYVKIRARNNEI